MNLDFSGIKDREPLAEGIYEVTVLEVDDNATSSKGSPMVKVTFEEPESKNRIFENFVLQDNTLWKIKEFLEALGLEVPKGALDIDFRDFVGTTVTVKVIQDTYEEKVTNRIKKYLK